MGKSFVQTLMAAMHDGLTSILELLQDPDARAGAGLNPDATPDSKTAQEAIGRIGDYFNSDNPGGEQYLRVVNDVILARDAIRDIVDVAIVRDDLSATIDEYLRFILEIAALDVVRGRFPYIYYAARLLAILDDFGAIQAVHRLQLDRLDRLFEGIPVVNYYGEVLASLPSDQLRADFALGALGALFKASKGLPFIGPHVDVSVFYGWDSLPGPGSSAADNLLERSLTVTLKKKPTADCTQATFVTCPPAATDGLAGALNLNATLVSAGDSDFGKTVLLVTAQLDETFTIDVPGPNPGAARGQIVVDTTGPARLGVFIGDGISVIEGVGPALPTLSLEYKPIADPQDTPTILFGSSKGTRLEFGRVGARAEVRPESGGANYGFRLSLNDAALVVVPDEGDGFISSILRALASGGELKIAFSLTLGVAKGLGFFIEGGTGLRVTLALGKQLGPVRIESLVFAIDAKTGDDQKFKLSTELDATLSFRTRGVSLTVDQMGVDWKLVPLGGMGFRPPKGLALSIDIGGVSGGGYLFFDADRGQYAGAVHLAFCGLAINGVGLVQTYTAPDGRLAYSFVIILSVEWPGGLQIGFGFTINGIGGLFGQNRGVAAEALQQGIKAGTLDAVLFPENPVDNAPRIVSVLSSVFPVTDGQTIFGPMIKLGWGTPTFISVALGLIIELEPPSRFILLGKAVADFPDKEHSKLHLELDCVGIFNPSTGESSFDATLYRSTVGPFTLIGDIVWRSAGGGRPFWILAIGGVNPHFDVPKGLLPPMNRIGINLVSGDNPRAWLTGYSAITSNTIQIGGAVDASYSKAGFTLAAHIGADVLIRLAGFQFIIDFNLSVSLKRGGTSLFSVGLSGTITGPKPLHFDGRASLDLFLFSISFHISFTIGSEDPAPLPSFSVFEPLVAALADPRNWSGALPESETMLVGLTKATSGSADPALDVVVHPIGELVVRQRVAPIGIALQRFSGGTISGDSRFSLQSPSLGSETSADTAPAVDFFAAGDFLELTDAQRLSRPAFENLQSGLVFGSQTARTGDALPVALGYKTIVKRKDQPTRKLASVYVPTVDKFLAAVRGGAAARSPLRDSGLRRFVGPLKQIYAIDDARYTVISDVDLTQPADLPAAVRAGTTYAAAADAQRLRPGARVAALHEVLE